MRLNLIFDGINQKMHSSKSKLLRLYMYKHLLDLKYYKYFYHNFFYLNHISNMCNVFDIDYIK